MTKTDKVVRALKRGKKLSSYQLFHTFKLLNPSSTIHRLRQQGHTINTRFDRRRRERVYCN